MNQKPQMRSRVGFALLAFVASFGFLLVNVVDPYSGAVASPDFQVSTDPFAGQPVQSLEVAGDYAVAAVSRDSYTVKEKPKPPPPPPPPPVEESSDSASGSRSSLPQVTPDPGSAQAYAHGAVLARGWSEEDFSCLVALWNQESGWRVNAINTSMGSDPATAPYGIPQAYPGGKMASAGADWETNAETQINWGLGYIAARGTPCTIWNNYGGSY